MDFSVRSTMRTLVQTVYSLLLIKLFPVSAMSFCFSRPVWKFLVTTFQVFNFLVVQLAVSFFFSFSLLITTSCLSQPTGAVYQSFYGRLQGQRGQQVISLFQFHNTPLPSVVLIRLPLCEQKTIGFDKKKTLGTYLDSTQSYWWVSLCFVSGIHSFTLRFLFE